MSIGTRFELFSDLPKELRLNIWELALCAPIAAVGRNEYCLVWHFDLFSDGVIPYNMGLSCKEAWRVMETMCSQISAHDKFPDVLLGRYWLDLDRTVFVIDKDFNGSFAFEYCLGMASVIKNFALAWRTEGYLISMCRAMSTKFPALNSISFHRVHGGRRKTRPLDRNVHAIVSSTLKLMHEHETTTLDDNKACPALLRKHICAMFKSDEPPRLHFIGLDAGAKSRDAPALKRTRC